MKHVHDEGAGSHRVGAPERLAGIDLNLLVALDALLTERHVTRAARRLGVSQSALSHTLRRLRTLLEDPLLVRGPGGMVPTPRAEALAPTIRAGLETLGTAIFEAPQFVPERSTRRFRILSPDLFDAVALPGVLGALAKEAPGVDVTVVSAAPSDVAAMLLTGDADVAIIAQFQRADPDSPVSANAPDWPASMRSRTLFRDRFACFVRDEHPLAGQPLELDTYVRAAHLMVSPSGEGAGVMDALLGLHQRQRRVALRIPHFASAPAILAGSDLVLTGPATLGLLAARFGCVSLAPPIPVPEHRITMMWHERVSQDPGHRWFRTLMARVAAELGITGDASG